MEIRWSYMEIRFVNKLYTDCSLDENDTNKLDTLNKNISGSYAAGKINNDQYTSLKNVT